MLRHKARQRSTFHFKSYKFLSEYPVIERYQQQTAVLIEKYIAALRIEVHSTLFFASLCAEICTTFI